MGAAYSVNRLIRRKMKVLWICGLPNVVRLKATNRVLSDTPTAAWSWILGHLPPPRDVELHIVCPVGGLVESRVDFDYGGAHWHCFRRERFELFFLWRRFACKIRSFVHKLAPDVIHGWGGETGCGLVATYLTKKAVVSVQGLLLMLFWQWFKLKSERPKINFKTRIMWLCEKSTYRRANILLVESAASQAGLKKHYGYDSVIIPHPLRREFLEADLSIRDRLVLAPIKFLYLGSLIARKGAIDALKAFAMLSRDESKLVMIGEGEDRSVIEDIISQTRLTDRVELCGTLSADEITKEFLSAQFFLLPSYGDTGPTALKEALASGLYPICYRNSGPEDLIMHYGCGELVSTGDIVALSETMNRCASAVSDCVRHSFLVSSGVRSELSPNVIWSQLKKIYAKQEPA